MHEFRAILGVILPFMPWPARSPCPFPLLSTDSECEFQGPAMVEPSLDPSLRHRGAALGDGSVTSGWDSWMAGGQGSALPLGALWEVSLLLAVPLCMAMEGCGTCPCCWLSPALLCMAMAGYEMCPCCWLSPPLRGLSPVLGQWWEAAEPGINISIRNSGTERIFPQGLSAYKHCESTLQSLHFPKTNKSLAWAKDCHKNWANAVGSALLAPPRFVFAAAYTCSGDTSRAHVLLCLAASCQLSRLR